jgi:solute carrier family 25 (mitochondrial uncoupling protein), member 8/9
VPIRDMITGPLAPGQNPTVFQKILAGFLSGGAAISIANPTDVVKVRLQAQGRLPKDQHLYNGTLHCYRSIIREDGVRGLWVGVCPNIIRCSIFNAALMSTYDQFKEIAV